MQLPDGPSFVAQYNEIFRWEAYDFPFAGTEPMIIDAGANLGLAILWWTARWPLARVVAFEPDPAIFQLLSANVAHLDLRRVELRRSAIVGTCGRVAFVPEGTDAGKVVSGHPADAFMVPGEDLGSVISQQGHVDLLKLDIEGAETSALIAAEDLLPKVDRIFVEYHSFFGATQRLDELVSCLRRSKYRIYLQAPQRRVRPFSGIELNRGIDFTCNIWAWREG